MQENNELLNVKNLKVSFHTRNGISRSVNDVSFKVEKGKTLGIVGESGSGKSVTAMSLMGLLPSPPAKIEGGEAWFQGKNLLSIPEEEHRKIRGNKISMVFQDPMTSLNPYLTIAEQLEEVLLTHDSKVTKKEARKKAIDMLGQVGIPAPDDRITQYPHQFSGGMRQRILIAMALISKPELLIADEPTTALDVTIQAQILELLKELQDYYNMGVILITHDLGVVAGMSHDIMVMYAGRTVEYGSVEDIFYHSQHPYTKGLLNSVPKINTLEDELTAIPGLPPDPSRLPAGCAFAPRCHKASEKCLQGVPVISKVQAKHEVYCHSPITGGQ